MSELLIGTVIKMKIIRNSREEIENARFILFRSSQPRKPSISTEFIRDSERLLWPEAQRLIEEIEMRQNEARIRTGAKNILSVLGEKTYADWNLQLTQMGLFYQADDLDGVIYKGQTNHRSHVPKEPTPAGLLRVTVIPVASP